MKLGVVVGYSQNEVKLPMDEILEAERLGYDSVWTAEAYGSDALTPAAWILAKTTKIKVGTAIMQIPARTPTSTAMSAMTLQSLSGGRFILGLGPSGPQVVEGWYGATYARPLTRMREYIDIIRQVIAREAPVRHTGYHYQLPYQGKDSTGMGARNKNFYNNYARQLGYEEAAINIQELFLSGKKPEAVEAVPVELVDDVALVGPPDRIKDNLPRWIEAGKKGHIGSFLASGASIEALRLLAEELL